MTLLLLLSLASIQLPQGDCAVVMLSGVPAEPWSGLSGEQLEVMWTYGIEGYQVTRSAWSGYILRGPEGSGELLTGICSTLAADSTVPDSSLWARTIQLVWNTNALPGYLVVEDSVSSFPVMPVRSSRWLEAGPDTLILSLPVENTLLFWAGGYSGDFQLSAWRGVGTEIIPSGTIPLKTLVSWTLQGSPGDIINLEYVPGDLDQWWGETWAPILALADSMVTSQFPSHGSSQNSLVWIRGTGGSELLPWKMIPSPSPLPVARHAVQSIPGIIPLFEMPEIPGILEVRLPGNAGSASRAAYAAALLERIVARMALPEGASVRGTYTPAGEVSLNFDGATWAETEALDVIGDELLPIIFTSPESELLNNAAIRAGIPPVDQRATIELLAEVTGFLP